jgi:uncharacterized membrane protein (UPF0127 family)
MEFRVSRLLVFAVLSMSTTVFTYTLRIGEHDLTVETASTPEDWYCGLMHHQSLADDEGMLLIYPDSQPTTSG